MRLEKNAKRQGQQGFTLVELAVVMIIVGLLIGGILKGQELITNAQVASAISQTKGIDAAVSTFRDSYRALPGDMANPGTRLPNCNAAPCNTVNPAANVNARIDQTPGAALAGGSEAQRFFVHLSAAELITGVQNQSSNVFGIGYPETPIGGGVGVGFHPSGTLGLNTNARGGHYLSIRSGAIAPADGNGPLNASQAQRIDTKMDDGSPNSGSVFPIGTGCQDGTTATLYNTANNPTGCNLFVKIQS